MITAVQVATILMHVLHLANLKHLQCRQKEASAGPDLTKLVQGLPAGFRRGPSSYFMNKLVALKLNGRMS